MRVTHKISRGTMHHTCLFVNLDVSGTVVGINKKMYRFSEMCSNTKLTIKFAPNPRHESIV